MKRIHLNEDDELSSLSSTDDEELYEILTKEWETNTISWNIKITQNFAPITTNWEVNALKYLFRIYYYSGWFIRTQRNAEEENDIFLRYMTFLNSSFCKKLPQEICKYLIQNFLLTWLTQQHLVDYNVYITDTKFLDDGEVEIKQFM
jgi:hypothetical protein